jgi:cytochrome c556
MNRDHLMLSTNLLTFVLSACFLLDASAQSKAADYAVNKRVVIQASAEEQAHVLTEMNGFLSSLHTINAALAVKDFALVAKAARMHGPNHGEKSAVELSFEAKAPAEWRVFASPMRKGFAETAKAAQIDPSVERVVAQLGKVTQNCVACHATFKITSP